MAHGIDALTEKEKQTLRLLVMLRPWQVNPPQQFLSTPGGVSLVAQLQWDGARQLLVNGRQRLQFTHAAQATALPFDRGLSLAALAAAPPLSRLADPQRHASGLWRWTFTLQPGPREVDIDLAFRLKMARRDL